MASVETRGDERLRQLMLRALADGPRDVLGLLDVARRDAPGVLRDHEGALHSLVHDLVRRGTIEVAGRSERGLALYRLDDGRDDTGAAPGPWPTPPAATPRDSKDAISLASGARDEADRGRIVSDALAHLARLREEDRRRRFGNVRNLRHLVRRADRRLPTVHVVSSPMDGLRRIVLHEGPWLAMAGIVFLLLRFFVVEVYVIPTESMVPTLLVDDRVVVFKLGWGDVPDRWGVFTYVRNETTYVKRVVGLPGDRLALLHGDVYADGRILTKPDDVREALRFDVDDWALEPVDEGDWTFFEQENERSWALRSTPRALGMELRDVYLDLLGDRTLETVDESSLVLALERGGAEWRLEATDEGISLVEERDGGAKEVLARSTVESISRFRLRLSIVDGVVRASAPGIEWKGARDVPSGAARIEVHARGAYVPVSIDMDRDVHYLSKGYLSRPVGSDDLAEDAFVVPPGHVFMLGDNTGNSEDSRSVGAIPIDNMVGPVSFHIWPLKRIGPVD
jgi:signal peptidase I